MITKKTLNTKQKGDRGEKVAIFYLQKSGFTIIGQNISFRVGEIDILAVKDGLMHFIEVKSSCFGIEHAISNVNPIKITRIKKAISQFFCNICNGSIEPIKNIKEYCISVIAVYFDGGITNPKGIRLIFMENI